MLLSAKAEGDAVSPKGRTSLSAAFVSSGSNVKMATPGTTSPSSQCKALSSTIKRAPAVISTLYKEQSKPVIAYGTPGTFQKNISRAHSTPPPKHGFKFSSSVEGVDEPVEFPVEYVLSKDGQEEVKGRVFNLEKNVSPAKSESPVQRKSGGKKKQVVKEEDKSEQTRLDTDVLDLLRKLLDKNGSVDKMGCS